jgi:DNA-binding transcriptional regulator YhcF (GntR family)
MSAIVHWKYTTFSYGWTLDFLASVDFISLSPGRKREQIVETITRLVAFGDFKIDEKLPSAVALAEKLEVNKTTIAEAYHTLGKRGIITLRRNVPPTIASIEAAQRFVADDIKERLSSAVSDARKLGWNRAQLAPLLADVVRIYA